ncbi:cell division protein ZapA [Chitinophaga silvatica]|uniref:Cell division protein ZapA n=1 Tax=Chitinophaga silvatica TaxID=2282649 RepID=A0A3E1YAL4_9BACT|nr:cell division protein ZapA [Chitinophaga silvatica]RFS22759.1 cell division protein ZapA [Chitinophaga silvatica]
MDTLIPVNIVVSDRSYRIKIKPEEEEEVRRIMKEVNEKIVDFKTSYAGKDLQDYIAMALIMYATHPVTSGGKAQASTTPFLLEKLEKLEEIINQALG